MINIEDLTLGQIKQLQNLLGAQSAPDAPDPLVGKYVVVRTYSAGVHAGTLVRQDKEVVLLSESRRLWSWKAKQGVALSGVAQFGLVNGCKIDAINSLIRLTNAIEVIETSTEARLSIHEYK